MNEQLKKFLEITQAEAERRVAAAQENFDSITAQISLLKEMQFKARGELLAAKVAANRIPTWEERLIND